MDLREIKEIRVGKSSKEFERSSEDCKSVDAAQCFVIFYGNEFKLHTLSVVGELISDFFFLFFFFVIYEFMLIHAKLFFFSSLNTRM